MPLQPEELLALLAKLKRHAQYWFGPAPSETDTHVTDTPETPEKP